MECVIGRAAGFFLHFLLAKLSHAKNATLAKNSPARRDRRLLQTLAAVGLDAKGRAGCRVSFVNREAVL
jgi:hypothetical protein